MGKLDGGTFFRLYPPPCHWMQDADYVEMHRVYQTYVDMSG